jgi:hypothetical protein
MKTHFIACFHYAEARHYHIIAKQEDKGMQKKGAGTREEWEGVRKRSRGRMKGERRSNMGGDDICLREEPSSGNIFCVRLLDSRDFRGRTCYTAKPRFLVFLEGSPTRLRHLGKRMVAP